MKIGRFRKDGETFTAAVNGGELEILEEGAGTGRRIQLADCELQIPVIPTKIVCVGRNYAEHAAELGNKVPDHPLLFLKAPSALTTHLQPIMLPAQSERVEHEAELAVVISRDCKDLGDNETTADYILGFTALNDVTARDLQKADVQFTRAKSFDTFCPIGPFIETDLDPRNITVSCYVNGVLKQTGNTSQMVFPVDFLIRYISRQMTLKAGDVIATGTPSGVSRLAPGDVCEVVIDGLDRLQNTCEAA